MVMTFKKTFWLVATVAVIAFISAHIVSIGPLRKSQSDLKAWILKEVPLGSSVDQVKALIKGQGWKLLAEWHGNPGKVSSDTAYPSIKDYPGVKGEYFIHADLGSYQGIPFRVGVDAHWGFDSTGKLLDLRIRKMSEGL
jgi:hypothetical protein